MHYYDPLVPTITLPGGQVLGSEEKPGTDWDLVIVHTLHPGFDYAWAQDCLVLDATYRFGDAIRRTVV